MNYQCVKCQCPIEGYTAAFFHECKDEDLRKVTARPIHRPRTGLKHLQAVALLAALGIDFTEL